jgi:hypothetical protein
MVVSVSGYKPFTGTRRIDVTERARGGAGMATEQEQLDPQGNEQAKVGEGATDYPKVQATDQSDVPHHPGADPNQQSPNQADQPETE